MTFDTFLTGGGLSTVTLIAGILFAVQTVFAFLLWRKGQKELSDLLRVISYLVASVTLIVSASFSFLALAEIARWLWDFVLYLLIICAPIAAGLQIYLFIAETWFKKEEKA